MIDRRPFTARNLGERLQKVKKCEETCISLYLAWKIKSIKVAKRAENGARA